MFKVLKFRASIILTVFLRKLFTLRTRLFHRKGTLEHWSSPVSWYSLGEFKTYWETLAAVGRYQNSCITGDEKKNFLEYTIEYVKKEVGERNLVGLSIGCGEEAKPEMVFCETGFFTSFEVMDIAGGLLKKQEKIARSRGLNFIKYTQQNLNQVVLEKNHYDLIWAIGTVHHIENLENFFEQVRQALKDNGIFVMREYVGPNYLQFTDDQLERVKNILKTLPAKYKRNWRGRPKKREPRIEIQQLIKTDPSEAVRSSEIMGLLEKMLQVEYSVKTGGTLLHPLLSGIAANFEIVPGGEAILSELIAQEKKLMAEGSIPSDYIFCIAKKIKHY